MVERCLFLATQWWCDVWIPNENLPKNSNNNPIPRWNDVDDDSDDEVDYDDDNNIKQSMDQTVWVNVHTYTPKHVSMYVDGLSDENEMMINFLAKEEY